MDSLKKMEILYRPLAWFQPYARNPRINAHAEDRMEAAIREYGFKVPMLARSNGEVVDGHLRLRVAPKAGLLELPVILCDEWSPAQLKAFRLLVNRSVTWADWDEELLVLELEDLKTLEFDLSLTGFDTHEIDMLLSDDTADEQANSGIEPLDHAVTIRGDLWQCGPHRVLSGDATDSANVARVLGDVRPRLMSTDPPYGVSYEPEWREQAGLGKQRQLGKVANDDRIDWTAAYRLFSGDVVYAWHAGIHSSAVAKGLEEAGFEIRAQIIWFKPHFVLSRGNYHWQHEPCWYCVRKGQSSHWRGDRTQSTVWSVASLNPFGGRNQEDSTTAHGTQKPIELMRRPILNHTNRGDGVYDPFLGSGTTLIAAELTGRICYGLEIDVRYVDLIVRRWQTLTGKSARLEGDGRSFDEVQAARWTASTDSSIDTDSVTNPSK
jgi:DNA modification methylase